MAKSNPNKISRNLFEEVSDFDIKINSFGEIETSISIDKLNDFLNQKGTKIQKVKSSKNEEE